MFEKILDEIVRHDCIILHRHTKPDGDALGSQIGLKHILKENYPDKRIYCVGDGAGRYAFMDDCQMDDIPDDIYDGALAIILDTSSHNLISDKRYTLAARTARIDHHIFCEEIADVEVVNTEYESCCGLVTEFAVESGLAIPPLAAKSLYTGMVTDSGRFRYDCTTRQTFRLASRLLEEPFSISEIYGNLYADDYEFLKLRAKFILKMRFTPNHVAYIYTDQDEVRQLGTDTFTLSRGLVNTMSDIKGVNIWVNFTESPEGVLCELRSSKQNINPIAVKYGGGGHAKASGATLKNKEEAMRMLADLDKMQGESNE